VWTALVETWRARELLIALTDREIKTRYRRSFLGLLWSLMTPLYQVVLMTIVFKYVVPLGVPNYSVKYLCALIPWTFFQQSVLTSCTAVLRARDVVKRIRFPRQVVPLATVLSCLFHMAVSLVILSAILLIIPVVQNLTALYLVALTLILVLMASGLSLLVSTLNTFYQDVEYILTNLMSAFMFLTPVVYPLESVPRVLRPYVMLNPLATICEGFRSVIVDKQPPDPARLLVAGVFALLCFLVGLWYFRRREWQFPEVL
jgi:ABC-2 type transport system permease protein